MTRAAWAAAAVAQAVGPGHFGGAIVGPIGFAHGGDDFHFLARALVPVAVDVFCLSVPISFRSDGQSRALTDTEPRIGMIAGAWVQSRSSLCSGAVPTNALSSELNASHFLAPERVG